MFFSGSCDSTDAEKHKKKRVKFPVADSKFIVCVCVVKNVCFYKA